uniref:Uncharacterized protein n=1 Tax=Tanacetum cinerariifolium TaxID=118510 RepID=A0A6L2LF85_TANCI|nr:hypothetical protein [Tanacetum cinerariifolium]
MEHSNPTLAKILILDTGKFEQWKFRIQQYLQNEHCALWEVIEFGDSYEAPQDDAATGSASEGSAKKKGRTVAVTTEDMQKRRNNVKARTTLLLALPDEHQLRFSKYKTTQELWAAILKTFGGNEATKKTKKNQLKQQYDNFKAEGSETLEQTFNRLHAIVSHLEFMDVEIEQDDLNQKFLTSLALEWLMYTIVWRNRSDLDTISLDDVYNHLKVYEPEVQKKSESNSQNMAFISSAKNSNRNGEVNTANIPTASTQVSPASANVAAASISLDTACAYIASQSNGSRAPRSQDRGRRENFKQGSKVEESAPKALMAIDGNLPLMAKSSSDNEVFDNSLCIKTCKKNTDSLNSKITELSEKLSDTKTNLHHYQLDLSQVEARLVEFKNQEIKFCEKIRGLEFKVESKTNRIGSLTNELEMLKKEKKVYSPPKKDMSWTRLSEFADDTITDYNKPSPSIESNSSDLQNSDSSVYENGESSESIVSKPMIKFVKAADSPTVIKTNKDETVRKPSVKYAEMYRKVLKSANAYFPLLDQPVPTISISIMARLAFCDYLNMIAILEKYEHNHDFHQIVDFVEATHIKYALTINPTVYVSYIRQFWSTARIETTNERTKILATVNGKPRTISESSIRRNLKLRYEAGISSLPDAELFENL